MKWTEKYKCGFSNGLGYATVEFLFDEKESDELKLALPDASTWNKKWLKKQTDFLNSAISKDFIGEVWLDDVLVRSV